MAAKTPAPPYYAVIFTSLRTEGDSGYATTAARMLELADQQPGFLGYEAARGSDGSGVSVCYWTTIEAIAAWKEHGEHLLAQAEGRATWYAQYTVRVAKVERAYGSAT